VRPSSLPSRFKVQGSLFVFTGFRLRRPEKYPGQAVAAPRLAKTSRRLPGWNATNGRKCFPSLAVTAITKTVSFIGQPLEPLVIEWLNPGS